MPADPSQPSRVLRDQALRLLLSERGAAIVLVTEGDTSMIPHLRGGDAVLAIPLVAPPGMGDLLLYRLGRRHGARFLASRRIARYFTPERRRWVERHFASHDFLTIAVARHASGFRLPVFATAGAMGVPLRTFLLADGLSALLSVPLVVSLGYLFASQLEQVKKHLREAELLGLLLIAAFAAATVLVKWRRRRAARAAAQARAEEPP